MTSADRFGSSSEPERSDVRVLIADDQKVVRDGLAMLLGLLPGIDVVGGLTIMLVRSGPVPGSAGRPCPLRVSCRWPAWPS